mmetsp:Transcript_120717/g.240409  ORF Transcript_120717/g.240409 Transcript_120717/m.240409 type:complete len:506 (-) Transcript_120717:72-1589(-)
MQSPHRGAQGDLGSFQLDEADDRPLELASALLAPRLAMVLRMERGERRAALKWHASQRRRQSQDSEQGLDRTLQKGPAPTEMEDVEAEIDMDSDLEMSPQEAINNRALSKLGFLRPTGLCVTLATVFESPAGSVDDGEVIEAGTPLTRSRSCSEVGLAAKDPEADDDCDETHVPFYSESATADCGGSDLDAKEPETGVRRNIFLSSIIPDASTKLAHSSGVLAPPSSSPRKPLPTPKDSLGVSGSCCDLSTRTLFTGSSTSSPSSPIVRDSWLRHKPAAIPGLPALAETGSMRVSAPSLPGNAGHVAYCQHGLAAQGCSARTQPALPALWAHAAVPTKAPTVATSSPHRQAVVARRAVALTSLAPTPYATGFVSHGFYPKHERRVSSLPVMARHHHQWPVEPFRVFTRAPSPTVLLQRSMNLGLHSYATARWLAPVPTWPVPCCSPRAAALLSPPVRFRATRVVSRDYARAHGSGGCLTASQQELSPEERKRLCIGSTDNLLSRR